MAVSHMTMVPSLPQLMIFAESCKHGSHASKPRVTCSGKSGYGSRTARAEHVEKKHTILPKLPCGPGETFGPHIMQCHGFLPMRNMRTLANTACLTRPPWQNTDILLPLRASTNTRLGKGTESVHQQSTCIEYGQGAQSQHHAPTMYDLNLHCVHSMSSLPGLDQRNQAVS